nr:Not22 [Drosophila melanogaster]
MAPPKAASHRPAVRRKKSGTLVDSILDKYLNVRFFASAHSWPLRAPGGAGHQRGGHPAGALHRDRLGGLHAGVRGLPERHHQLQSVARRHRTSCVSSRLRVHLLGSLLRHVPRNERSPGAVHLRRDLPAPAGPGAEAVLEEQKGAAVCASAQCLHVVSDPLDIRAATVQRSGGSAAPLCRTQFVPGQKVDPG